MILPILTHKHVSPGMDPDRCVGKIWSPLLLKLFMFMLGEGCGGWGGGGGGGATHLMHSWLTTGLFSDITSQDKAIEKVNIFRGDCTIFPENCIFFDQS